MIAAQMQFAPESRKDFLGLLKCKSCGAAEWFFRSDLRIECVLCESILDARELIQEHDHGYGHWTSVEH